ncbi:hypothetical protein [Cohnella nanjingensis]|uniref:Uncharacterized protein n=1 Tax=Cohnella nanjingensis TaxID=1387779 RepID=A0A7X0VHH2_9BACL|nr:hypothetical protein [Cohnella nanjingensis]MBB6672624.1 hypothetical protein [Cohnella nanjingensis]
MAGTYGTPDYAPTSGPVDFERLFVKGVEVVPGASGGAKIANIKPISTRGDVDATVVAKSFNALLVALKEAGIMADN